MNKLTNDVDDNYQLFLADAIDNGVVWGLAVSDEQFAVCDSESEDEREVMPFWSQEQFAEALCVDEWSDYEVQAVDLDDFIDNWLPGMQKDGLLVGVNWTPDLEGAEMEPLDLSLDLLETD